MPWDLLRLLYDVVEVVVPLALLPVVALRHRPEIALGWLLLTLIVPIIGLVLYLYLGAYRRRRHREANRHLRAELGELLSHSLRGPEPEPQTAVHGSLMSLVRRAGRSELGGWPAVGGNGVEVISDCEELIDRMIGDIDAARSHVHLLFYTFDGGRTAERLVEALIRAAGRGVQCRLLAGAFSSHFEGDGSLFDRLGPRAVEAGVEVLPLEPLNPLRRGLARLDLRNHRKIAVMDGTVAYAGSQNIHDPDTGLEEGIWQQMMVRIEGPGARQLQGVFVQDWLRHRDGEARQLPDVFPSCDAKGEVTIQTVAWGPGDPLPPSIHLFAAVLNAAHERAILATAYFAPDEPTLLALRLAAYRGVQVDVVLPHRTDKAYVDAAARSYFDELLDVGVRIHRHRGGVLHSKCVSVDDSIAVVGSANCDRRSLYLDYEVAVLIYSAELARRVREVQEGYLSDAGTVDPRAWAGRSTPRRTVDRMAGLLSPLL